MRRRWRRRQGPLKLRAGWASPPLAARRASLRGGVGLGLGVVAVALGRVLGAVRLAATLGLPASWQGSHGTDPELAVVAAMPGRNPLPGHLLDVLQQVAHLVVGAEGDGRAVGASARLACT